MEITRWVKESGRQILPPLRIRSRLGLRFERRYGCVRLWKRVFVEVPDTRVFIF